MYEVDRGCPYVVVSCFPSSAAAGYWGVDPPGPSPVHRRVQVADHRGIRALRGARCVAAPRRVVLDARERAGRRWTPRVRAEHHRLLMPVVRGRCHAEGDAGRTHAQRVSTAAISVCRSARQPSGVSGPADPRLCFGDPPRPPRAPRAPSLWRAPVRARGSGARVARVAWVTCPGFGGHHP